MINFSLEGLIKDILVPATLIGLVPAFIAKSKGRNFILWWIYGIGLFIIAIIHVFVIKSTNQQNEKDML